MKFTTTIAAATLALSFGSGPVSAQAPYFGVRYSLHVLPEKDFQARTINDSGQVSGRVRGAGGFWSSQTGFLRTGASEAWDMNNAGQVVGDGYVWSVGSGLQSIPINARAINDYGDIVGLDGQVQHADGRSSQIPVPAGFERLSILDLNNNGVAVGNVSYLIPGEAGYNAAARFNINDGASDIRATPSDSQTINEHGTAAVFDWETGTALWNADGTDEALPLSIPLGINDAGMTVGGSFDSAMIAVNGITLPLQALLEPGATIHGGVAADINNRGEIVGWARINGETRSYILTPNRYPFQLSIPTPASTSLLATAGIFACRRRR